MVAAKRTVLVALAVSTGWWLVLFLFRTIAKHHVVDSLAVYAIAATIVVAASERDCLRRLCRPNLRSKLFGFVSGILLTGATYPGYELASWLLPSLKTEAATLYAQLNDTGHPWAGLAIVFVILGEEVIWRGPLLSLAVNESAGFSLGSFRTFSGIASVTALYAVAQTGLGLPWLGILALLCGPFWCWVRLKSGDLVASFISHLVWNFFVLYAFPVV